MLLKLTFSPYDANWTMKRVCQSSQGELMMENLWDILRFPRLECSRNCYCKLSCYEIGEITTRVFFISFGAFASEGFSEIYSFCASCVFHIFSLSHHLQGLELDSTHTLPLLSNDLKNSASNPRMEKLQQEILYEIIIGLAHYFNRFVLHDPWW